MNQHPNRPRTSHRRYAIFALLFVLVTINYVDRGILSVAGPSMASEFGWSLGVLGLALSAIFWTYTPMLWIWGAIIDRIGEGVSYAIGLLIWSVAAMATGAINGFTALLAARCGLGLGESVMPSACAKTVRKWAPVRERGWSTAGFTAGYYAGPAVGLPLSALLISLVGWRGMFYALGGFSLVFFFVWLIFYREPGKARWLGREELELIRAGKDRETPARARLTRASAGQWLGIFRQGTTWGLIVAQGVATYLQYMLLTWLPTYLLHAQHIKLIATGLYGAIPYIITIAICLSAGWLSDRVLKPGQAHGGRRRWHVIIALAGMLVILLLPATHGLGTALVILSISLGGSAATLTTNVALANDVLADSDQAGFLFGLIGLGANALALLAPVMTGLLAQLTGSFSAGFVLAGGLTIIGILCVLILVRKPIVVGPPASGVLPGTADGIASGQVTRAAED